MSQEKDKNNENIAGYKIINKKAQEQLSNEDEQPQQKNKQDDSEDYNPENSQSPPPAKTSVRSRGRKSTKTSTNKRKKTTKKDDDDEDYDGKSDRSDGEQKKKRKGRPAGSKNKSRIQNESMRDEDEIVEGSRSSKRIKFSTREGYKRDLQRENWPTNEQLAAQIKPFLDEVENIPALTAEDLELLYSCLDLTSLNSTDADNSIKEWLQKNLVDVHTEYDLRPAAICVFSNFASQIKNTLFYNQIKGVNVAVVSTNFPTGQTFLDVKTLETKTAVKLGAEEVDMVVSRGLWNDGKEEDVLEEIYQTKKSCGQIIYHIKSIFLINRTAHLKVILENCELKDYASIYKLSYVSLCAGGDFIKTSTGKGKHGALINEYAVMLLALRDFVKDKQDNNRGIKAAGGISDSITAMKFYKLTKNILGYDINASNFRIGTSSLAGKMVQQIKDLRKK